MSAPAPKSTFPPPAPVPFLSITPNVPETALAELVVLMVFEFVALVCIILRVWARLKKKIRFALNDYAIFWAFV